MSWLMIDGMDQYQTERFFRYIDLNRLPKNVRNASVFNMAYWFFKRCFPDNYKTKTLYQFHITDDPIGFKKRNGGYLV